MITVKTDRSIDRQSDLYKKLHNASAKLLEKDSSLWGPAAQKEASIRLNWVDLPHSSVALLPQLDQLKAKFSDRKKLILCGMGGSSLGPEVIAASFKKEIFILDSTDPDYLTHALQGDFSESVILIGSKSGSTLETSSQKLFFEKFLADKSLNPAEHIVIVTDPDSLLDKSSRESGYTVINADPHVGGRFSVLSAFGLVPAALCGVDCAQLLSDAREFFDDLTPAIDLAYLLATEVEQYCGFTDAGSGYPGLSDWIEQLIAESTGKDGVGRLPIVTENAESASATGFGITFASGGDCDVVAPLGAHFIFWEWVTALLGVALEIDPFNQPNVTEAKEQSSALLNEWNGKVPTLTPTHTDGVIERYGISLGELLKEIPQGGYLAIMVYLDRRDDAQLSELRSIIASKRNIPVTFGWGPRFLHSTGQFHKAGQPNGVFLQISGECAHDYEVPGKNYTFRSLINAQCQGDGRALLARKYPTTRLHLLNRKAGISQLLAEARAL